jgi:hypothetical protein
MRKMPRKLMALTVLCLCGLLPVAVPIAPALAQAVIAQGREADPLMVIRFNQAKVNYKPRLKMAVQQALDIKPSVMFVITSYVPKTRNMRRNQEHDNIASHNARKIYNFIKAHGVAEPQIQMQREDATNLRYDEVKIRVY